MRDIRFQNNPAAIANSQGPPKVKKADGNECLSESISSRVQRKLGSRGVCSKGVINQDRDDLGLEHSR